MMRRFWFGLWTYWIGWSTLWSLLSAALLAGVITAVLYVLKGSPAIEGEVFGALRDIARFWFAIIWSLTLLIALFLVVKRLFYRCIDHKELALEACSGREDLEQAGMRDVIKIWRKWLMAIIWASAAQVIIVIAVLYLFGSSDLLSWFSVYWLYLFLSIAGLLTLPLMEARCKLVKVRRC